MVGLLNLVATTTLGIRERRADIGILKTLGFTPRQVAVSIATGTASLALAAVALGVPAGLLLAKATLGLTGRASGIGPEFGISPSPAEMGGGPATAHARFALRVMAAVFGEETA